MWALFFIAGLVCVVALAWLQVRSFIADCNRKRSYFEQRRSGILKPGDLN